MEGDFFTGASLATSLTKLALRYCDAVQLKRYPIFPAYLFSQIVLHFLNCENLMTEVNIFCFVGAMMPKRR